MLGASALSSVSGMVSHRRHSTIKFNKRRQTRGSNVSTEAVYHRQLTGVERVKPVVYLKYFKQWDWSYLSIPVWHDLEHDASISRIYGSLIGQMTMLKAIGFLEVFLIFFWHVITSVG
uniref:Uncharacterized protein n=1 Tax=Ditylenchus dipsaci TaxID=166011 RepID=A0A915E6E9_9BILA